MPPMLQQPRATSERHTHAQSHRFMTYPNGGTVRSLCFDICKNATEIMSMIDDTSYLPSWNLMLVSQAYENITHVYRYIHYEATRSLSGSIVANDTEIQNSFPNGGAVRSLLLSCCAKTKTIAQIVRDHEDTPAWCLMLMSQAADEISHVSSYLTYELTK